MPNNKENDPEKVSRPNQLDEETSKLSRELKPISPSPVRHLVGSGSVKVSEWINDNIVVARYAAITSIGILALYGLSHSPLFFRYRTVSEIPPKYFQHRKTLVGRLVETSKATTPEVPIMLKVYALSPFERLLLRLPGSCFERWMKLHPSAAALGKRPDQNPKELLHVELAGVRSPPDYYHAAEAPGAWLQSWVSKEKPLVTCQLLARRVTKNNQNDLLGVIGKKRKIPELNGSSNSIHQQQDLEATTTCVTQVAVCKIFYRQKTLQLLATDLAHALTLKGRATASNDDGLFPRSGVPNGDSSSNSSSSTIIVDATNSIKVLQADAKYVTKLGRAEYEAARGSYGLWADHEVRKSRSDVVEEVEFQDHAPIWKKVWRWLKGG